MGIFAAWIATLSISEFVLNFPNHILAITDRDSDLAGILVSTCIWSSLSLTLWFLCRVFLDKCTKKPTNYEVASNATAVVHASLMTYYGFMGMGDAIRDLECPTTQYQRLVMRVMCGYFLYDGVAYFVWELLGRKKAWSAFSWDVFAHHLGSVTTIYYTLLQPYGGAAAVCMIPFVEWTTPFISTTWIMKYYGFDKTWPKLTLVLKVTFALLFTIGRMVFVNYLCFKSWLSPCIDNTQKCLQVFIPLISIFWQKRIVKFVMKAINGDSRKTNDESPSDTHEKRA